MLKYFWKDELFEAQDDRYFRLIDRSEGMRDLFNSEILGSGDYSPFEEFKGIFNKEGIHSYINKMMYFDIKGSLPALLQVEDRTSMAVGIESRLPLLDYRIAELLATISPKVKFKGGKSKAMFKKVIRNIVPQEILNRKDKMGFPVPLVEWYKDSLKDYIEEIILSDITKNRGIYNIDNVEKVLSSENKFSRVTWGLLCLELWFRTFID